MKAVQFDRQLTECFAICDHTIAYFVKCFLEFLVLIEVFIIFWYLAGLEVLGSLGNVAAVAIYLYVFICVVNIVIDAVKRKLGWVKWFPVVKF